VQKSKFSAEQITQILKEASQGVCGEVARKYGITSKTIGNWRRKYDGMGSSDVKRLKQLEEENTRLKRVVANLTLDLDGARELLSKKW
jgi:putative transposase